MHILNTEIVSKERPQNIPRTALEGCSLGTVHHVAIFGIPPNSGPKL